MTAEAFLSSLEARGVRLVPDSSAPSGVRVSAPRGVVTPQVAEKIRVALPILLPLLAPAIDPELLALGAEVEREIARLEEAKRRDFIDIETSEKEFTCA